MPNSPAVFVSSTCYDLKQVRKDLSQFIETELGYRAILSEQPSFPVDPDIDTIDNCRRRVEQDATIFVLVIGGRYGYVDKPTAKSITNLEYLTARAKGIPIYAFIDKQVLAVLPFWESNKTADFSKQVDNVALFEFINKVMYVDKVWTHNFETAQDITHTLRTQFAHMMSEGLQWRLQLKKRGYEGKLAELSAKAFRIALEQPIAWEYKLFAQSVTDEIERSRDIRREHKAGVIFGPSEYVSPEEFPNWIRVRFQEIRLSATGICSLLDTNLTSAFGLPGQQGDAEEIYFVARQMGLVYRQQIEWTQRIRRAFVEPKYRELRDTIALFTDQLINEFEKYGPDFLAKIEEALANSQEGKVQTIQHIFNMEIANYEKFEMELQRLMEDEDFASTEED